MDTQQFNHLYDQRIAKLKPYIMRQARGNDDLVQEQYIGVYLALKDKPDCNEQYLKASAKWNMIISTKKGRSIDNGFWKREDLEVVHCYQTEDMDIAANILKDSYRKPVDEQVIEKIAFENFLACLTETEKRFVQHRIVGWTVAKIREKLELSKEKVREMKREIRFKIGHAFA